MIRTGAFSPRKDSTMRLNFARPSSMVLAATVGLLGFAGAAHAESGGIDLGDLMKKNTSTEQQVSTITHGSLAANRVPATVEVITDEQIEDRGYANLEEVLHDLAGFDFSRAYGEEYSTIYMRGYRGLGATNRFLFLVDGVPDNDLWNSFAWIANQYSLSDIKRIELTYGPASALYGGNASQGLINIITKKGDEQSGGKIQVGGGQLGTGYTDFSYGSSAAGPDITIAGRVFHQDGRPDGTQVSGNSYGTASLPDGNTPGVGLTKNDYGFRTKIGMNGGFTLGAATWSRKDAQGYSFSGTGRSTNDGANWDPTATNIYGRYQTKIGENANFTSLLSYRYDNLNGSSTYFFPRTTTANGKTTTTWVESWKNYVAKEFSISNQLELDPWSNLTVVGGLDLANDMVQGALFTGTQSYPEQSGNMLGNTPVTGTLNGTTGQWERFTPGAGNFYDITRGSLYAQGLYTPWEPVTLTLGGRYDYRLNRELPGYGGQGGVFQPRMGAVYAPTDHWTFKALYVTGFTDPDNATMFANSSRTTPNPNLQPEQLHGYELATGYKVNENLNNELSIYYNEYANVFENVQVTPTQTSVENSGSRYVTGAEYRLAYTILPGLKSYFNYTFDSSLNQLGLPAGDIAPSKANVGLDGRMGNFRWSLRENWIGPRITVPTNPVGAVPSYFLTNASIGYVNLFVPGVRADFTVDNLFDTSYNDPGVNLANGSTYATLLPQNGRTFLGRITYSF